MPTKFLLSKPFNDALRITELASLAAYFTIKANTVNSSSARAGAWAIAQKATELLLMLQAIPAITRPIKLCIPTTRRPLQTSLLDNGDELATRSNTLPIFYTAFSTVSKACQALSGTFSLFIPGNAASYHLFIVGLATMIPEQGLLAALRHADIQGRGCHFLMNTLAPLLTALSALLSTFAAWADHDAGLNATIEAYETKMDDPSTTNYIPAFTFSLCMVLSVVAAFLKPQEPDNNNETHARVSNGAV